MNAFVLVFVGGGVGSVLRLAVYRLARLWLPANFPWGTLAVNAFGGLLAGLVSGWLLSRSTGGSDPRAIFLLTGVLGGFTTFSAFSLETVLLWQRGDGASAILYVIASLVLATVGVVGGLGLARVFV